MRFEISGADTAVLSFSHQVGTGGNYKARRQSLWKFHLTPTLQRHRNGAAKQLPLLDVH